MCKVGLGLGKLGFTSQVFADTWLHHYNSLSADIGWGYILNLGWWRIMDEAVSSTQNEQVNNGGISILPQSSYDVYLSQAEQVAPPTVDLEDPGFQEHVNRYE